MKSVGHRYAATDQDLEDDREDVDAKEAEGAAAHGRHEGGVDGVVDWRCCRRVKKAVGKDRGRVETIERVKMIEKAERWVTAREVVLLRMSRSRCPRNCERNQGEDGGL